ncbi:hypothetical protein [Vibrio diabolicus]|uniref:hypothetical protein n=1 Tax=Vibrio diabolicus TaxID=50719 RepID=UPI003D7D4340
MHAFKVNIAELMTIRLQSSSFLVINEDKIFEGGNLKVTCELTLADDEVTNGPIEGDCIVSVLAQENENSDVNLFEYNYEYVAFFNITDAELFSELDNHQRADYCLEKIYPIIREDMMSCFDRAGLRQIHIPYNFKYID